LSKRTQNNLVVQHCTDDIISKFVFYPLCRHSVDKHSVIIVLQMIVIVSNS